ncbi:uncharacterized protein FOMMEDRAFT_76607 [Fomitiporia mediterranea MF3/22]|uniref:uncharacterized protein n=1 Tax=Fomitiporia mediterranea (strain MF3/22) TaxID=694068 RepID=UPI0004408555|nr:uncharacterized protein FOMMEDRAFT_76607 [Fomitiporia mediterranea MF3/22]EJD06874.1 hypothetical protein FOMMEDRAFT_76607 [Fomitiporia mediterranea MF3/22]
MIIPINISAATSDESSTKFPPQLAKLGTDEVIIIELQGSFHVEGDQSGHLAARLKLENVTKPTLLIGHNLLEGKVVNLSKPLAVLYRKDRKDDSMDIDQDPLSGERKVQRACEYDMLAVVKRKVLFSKRPMPVVNVSSVPTDNSTKSAV